MSLPDCRAGKRNANERTMRAVCGRSLSIGLCSGFTPGNVFMFLDLLNGPVVVAGSGGNAIAAQT